MRTLGPLTYQSKANCHSVTCRRWVSQDDEGKIQFASTCMGWHCSYCDKPTGSQGHRCDASEAILGEAQRIADEDEA